MPIKFKKELSELSKKEFHKSIKGKLAQKKERISLTELISNIFEYVSNIDAPWYKFPIHTKEKNITPNTNKPMKNKLPHLKKNFVFSKKIFRTIFSPYSQLYLTYSLPFILYFNTERCYCQYRTVFSVYNNLKTRKGEIICPYIQESGICERTAI